MLPLNLCHNANADRRSLVLFNATQSAVLGSLRTKPELQVAKGARSERLSSQSQAAGYILSSSWIPGMTLGLTFGSWNFQKLIVMFLRIPRWLRSSREAMLLQQHLEDRQWPRTLTIQSTAPGRGEGRERPSPHQMAPIVLSLKWRCLHTFPWLQSSTQNRLGAVEVTGRGQSSSSSAAQSSTGSNVKFYTHSGRLPGGFQYSSTVLAGAGCVSSTPEQDTDVGDVTPRASQGGLHPSSNVPDHTVGHNYGNAQFSG